jgi:hypothetical protein
VQTPWGTIIAIGCETRISATDSQLYDWAHRLGNSWPCATLQRGGWATFASNGDLVAMSASWHWSELDGAELNAWANDVKAYANAHR